MDCGKEVKIMLICESNISSHICGDKYKDDWDKPTVNAEVIVLGYEITENYFLISVTDERYIPVANIVMLTQEPCNQQYVKFINDINAVDKEGNIDISKVEDFQFYTAKCVWFDEYISYQITELTPVLGNPYRQDSTTEKFKKIKEIQKGKKQYEEKK